MHINQQQFSATLPFPADQVFDWHLQQGAIERMLPPWRKVKILEAGRPSVEGSTVDLAIKVGPFWMPWVLEHRNFVPGQEFMDVQVKGPFASWTHLHQVRARSKQSSDLIDEIEYKTSFRCIDTRVRKELSRYFQWRQHLLTDDLATYHRYPAQKLRILLSGAGGFIGRSLKAFLQAGGHEVVSLVRSKKRAESGAIYWNPVQEEIEIGHFEGFDAVIHLAGENIASNLWTKKFKDKLFLSRCRDTWLLSKILLRLKSPPRSFLCASAVGIYGDRGDEVLTESTSRGVGFLSDLCTKWEQAAQSVEGHGIRVVNMRFGYILSPSGGMLGKMLPAFQWGLGGKIGSGKQFMPWVALDDVVGAIYHALMNETVSGPLNIAAPFSVTQSEYARLLAKTLRRLAFFHLPAFLLRSILGEMADALMLASAKVQPKKLLDSGYVFRFADLESAFRYFF